MGFFSSQFWKVIDWVDDSKDTLVYRFPMDGKEIMSGSSLTVRESQIAMFVNEGKVADVFGPGRYKLESRNLPFLTAMGTVFFQGKSRFRSEVYFINTKQFTNQKWGTTNPITLRDVEFGMVRIRGFGVFSFKVGDAKIFLNNLFGTNSQFTVDDINNYLKSLLVSGLSDIIAESKVSALDMASNLNEFGAMATNGLQHKFSEMGLVLTNFTIENISFPEAIEKAIDERTTLGILGDKMGTYTQKKAADALGDAAKNTGTTGAFIGMGMGANVGSALGNVFGNLNNAKDQAKGSSAGGSGKFCDDCGAALGKGKFCPDCGKKIVETVCPECGAGIKAGTKFCAECGYKLK